MIVMNEEECIKKEKESW